MFRQLARPWLGWALSVGVANKILIDLSRHMTFNFMVELRVLPQIKREAESMNIAQLSAPGRSGRMWLEYFLTGAMFLGRPVPHCPSPKCRLPQREVRLIEQQ